MMHKLSTGRKIYTKLMQILMSAAAFTVIALLIGIVGYIIFRGVPNVTLKLITSKPSLLRNIDGILPNILNTVYIVLITLVFVLPIGVGSAIYLTEYAKNKKIVRIVELAAETLSGIPSIIYGLVGLLIFVEFFGLGTSILAGSFTLVIMTLPTVIRTTEESLKTVPNS